MGDGGRRRRDGRHRGRGLTGIARRRGCGVNGRGLGGLDGSRGSRGVGRGLLGGGLLRRRLLLLGLDVATKTVAVGLAADAVGLRVLDARGVALGLDAEISAEIQRFLVGEAELTSKLVDPDLRCQASPTPFRLRFRLSFSRAER
jgi:hypothetical protein